MVMAALTKKGRDALPEAHFAVPGKRKLPIHDATHTKLAWDMVERTGGLTSEEKKAARSRILRRAKELGINTDDWNKIKAVSIAAMAIAMPEVSGHPNKMPFSGVLTRIGEPSDEAPHGSGGRRVRLTMGAAQAALASLLGMAVDFTPDFDDHDAQKKIGIITSADIEGDAILIEGFLYAADFPKEADRIRADKDLLGFSFEAQNVLVADPTADILDIVSCVFTGAAILRKDKAAYQSTSLAAAADMEFKMTKEELLALLGEVLPGAVSAAVATAVKPLEDQVKKVEASTTAAIQANANTMSKVEPHAKNLEVAASAMEADGVGCAAQGGHVSVLRRMASGMRASAAVGQVPHIFRDHDYPYYAGADRSKTVEEVAEQNKKSIDSAVEAAVKPLKDELAVSATKIADLTAAAKKDSTAPVRQTISPAITRILSRADLTAPEGEAKFEVGKLDAALTKSGLSISERMRTKTALTQAGLL